MSVRQMLRSLTILTALAACTRTSEKYCGLHPEDLANCAPSDAARQQCTADPECAAGTPHCRLDGAGGECVECFEDAHCVQVGKLACDPDTLTCRSCVEHADCPGSNACLPDGTCGDDSAVIYVGEGGSDAGTCTRAAPCATVRYALGQLRIGTRFHVKLSGALEESVVVDSKRIVLLAEPATTLTGDPPLKIVKGTVTVLDLELACSGMGGAVRAEMASTTILRDVHVHGCAGMDGAIAAKGGYLAITRSRIVDNPGGGITTDAAVDFAITNSIIARNGDANSRRGGVSLGAPTEGMNKFEHNTVVDNRVKMGAAGVACAASNALVAAHNLVAGNLPANTAGCDFARSKIEAQAATLLFTPDYHLMAGSPAIDQVDSAIDDDIDGQFRPQGTRSDFGADEYRP